MKREELRREYALKLKFTTSSTRITQLLLEYDRKLQELAPLPPAEGAEEITQDLDELIERLVPINAANFEFCVKQNIVNGGLLQGIRNVATLHAQKIADKMVEERLREELIAYGKVVRSWGIAIPSDILECSIDEYLKSRENE